MAKVFGSITITDIVDVGRLSSYITSNLPQTVIENPNESTTQYTPDWSKTPLTLNPIVYFNDRQLKLPQTGLTITWKRQEGSNQPTDLLSGETVQNGVLTVSQNFLSTSPSGLITYIANIKYTDQVTNVTLESQSQMSFSLSKQASEAKYCSISGESVFLYNTNQTLVGTGEITLNASLTNVSVNQWQYKNSSGAFVAMPTTNNPTINGTTIKIKANENILFNNDIAVIKLTTDDSSVYDLHTITKIRDGAAGSNTVTVVLSNENHTLPSNSQGVVNSYIGAETTISIFEGGTDVTSKWVINAEEGEGVTGNFVSNKYTVTGLTTDVGYVEFTCTRSNYSTLKKRFTLTKQYAGLDGADAVVYYLKSSTATMNLNKNKVFNPSNVVFSATKQIGAATSQTTYSGRFKIFESLDGTNWGTAKYVSSSNETSKTYTPSSTNIKGILCELYASGGTTTKLDSQTVMITKDGDDGESGINGEGGISVILGNEAEVIPCKSNGTTSIAKDISIPFYGYKGTQRVAISCVVGSLPEGVTVKTNTAGTVSTPGLLIISIPAGNALGSSSDLSGNFTLTFTCEKTSVEKKFGWTKSIQAANSVLFQIFAPNGDVIVNEKNNVVLETQLTDGSQIISSGITYQWFKFSGGSYQNIAGQTAKNLTVTPQMVESLASFKCEATYGGKKYIAFWCVTDKNDPIELILMCSVGTQLTSEAPFGVVYTLAYMNGQEVDAIKTTSFLTSAPSSASEGDYYYHVDKTKKTVTLKKYSGTSWSDAPSSDQPKGTYKYYRRNASGTELDTTSEWKTGKVIYVDRDVVNKSLVINCEADVPLA